MSRLVALIIAVVELLLLRVLELWLIELTLVLAAHGAELAVVERWLILIAECVGRAREAAWLSGVSAQVLVMPRLIAAIVRRVEGRRRLELLLTVRLLLLILAIHGLHIASRLVRFLQSLVLGGYRRTERAGSKRRSADTEAGRLLRIRAQVLVMACLIAAIVGCLVRLLLLIVQS